jgi:hypothetical protein
MRSVKEDIPFGFQQILIHSCINNGKESINNFTSTSSSLDLISCMYFKNYTMSLMGKPSNIGELSNHIMSKSCGHPQKISKSIEGYIFSQGAMIPSIENMQYNNVESRMTSRNISVESPKGR